MSNANCKEMLFQFITSCLIHSLGDQNHQVCMLSHVTTFVIVTVTVVYLVIQLKLLLNF